MASELEQVKETLQIVQGNFDQSSQDATIAQRQLDLNGYPLLDTAVTEARTLAAEMMAKLREADGLSVQLRAKLGTLVLVLEGRRDHAEHALQPSLDSLQIQAGLGAEVTAGELSGANRELPHIKAMLGSSSHLRETASAAAQNGNVLASILDSMATLTEGVRISVAATAAPFHHLNQQLETATVCLDGAIPRQLGAVTALAGEMHVSLDTVPQDVQTFDQARQVLDTL